MDTKDYLLKRIEDLKKEIQALQAALNTYEEFSHKDSSLKKDDSTVFISKINVEIPKDSTWTEKVAFVIRDRNRFLHNSEITEALKPYYSNKSEREIKRRISSVLSHALRNDQIEGLTNYRYSNSPKDTVWGKKDWLDENGEIISEFKQFGKINYKNKVKIKL